jgi:hypothetical protein
VDQLATRVPLSATRVPRSTLWHLRSIAIDLLPWTALVATSGRAFAGAFRRWRTPLLSALGWTGLLVTLSAVPAFTRLRYTAPALPVLAVACALLLVTVARDPGGARRVRVLTQGILALVALGALALTLAGSVIAATWAVAGTLIVVGAALAARARGDVFPLVALGLVIMLAGALGQLLVRPTVSVSPAPALTACLTARGPDGVETMLVGNLEGLAAQLRLASGGRLRVKTVTSVATLRGRTAEPGVAVAPEGIARRLESEGWRLEQCGRELRGQRWTARDYWHLVRTSELDALYAEKERRFYVARRAPS